MNSCIVVRVVVFEVFEFRQCARGRDQRVDLQFVELFILVRECQTAEIGQLLEEDELGCIALRVRERYQLEALQTKKTKESIA